MVAFTSMSLALLAALWPSLALTAACVPASSGLATTTTTSWRPIFTVPSDADKGQNILPNVQDPQAVNVQDVCPGYKASGVANTANGFTANLDIAGPACNVYGNDIANLTLSVEYQAADRVNIQIQPRYIGSENETWFILPESIIPRPGVAANGAGHMAVRSMFGGSSGGHGEAAPAAAPAPQAQAAPPAAQYGSSSFGNGGSCQLPQQDLYKCLQEQNGNASACQFYFDALKQCQEGH